MQQNVVTIYVDKKKPSYEVFEEFRKKVAILIDMNKTGSISDACYTITKDGVITQHYTPEYWVKHIPDTYDINNKRELVISLETDGEDEVTDLQIDALVLVVAQFIKNTQTMNNNPVKVLDYDELYLEHRGIIYGSNVIKDSITKEYFPLDRFLSSLTSSKKYGIAHLSKIDYSVIDNGDPINIKVEQVNESEESEEN